jgi:4-hydroxybenzoyl-CoA reductase subunit beta
MSNEAIRDFALVRPGTVAEAVTALAADPGARVCAGGTDLIVNLRRGLVEAGTLVDLGHIAAMRGISATDTGLTIGAGVTLRELAEHPALIGAYRAIVQAALAVAGPSHREAATLGGNLCLDTRCLYYNQSHWWRQSNGYCLKYRGEICHVAPKGNRCRAAFCGDMAPALLVLGARVEIAGPAGTRQIPLGDLYREDGMDYLTLQPGELLVAVHVPAAQAVTSYDKIRIRGAIDFPLAGVAVACVTTRAARRVRLAITGTNSAPVTIDDLPPLAQGDDPDIWLAALEKQVQRAVSPQRTTTIAPHYRRLSVSALAARLTRDML